MKKLVLSFVLGMLALNVFSQGGSPEYVELPLRGNLEYKPPISFTYQSTFMIDSMITIYKPGLAAGMYSYVTHLLNLTNNRVGIGTTSPKSRLHVVGDGLVSERLIIGDTLATNFVQAEIKLRIGNLWTFSDLNHGKIMGYNCRFWDQNQQSKRLVNGAAAAMALNTDGSIQLRTAPSGSEVSPLNWNYLTMLNNGNVGIGISTPEKRLHVQGDSYFNGNVGIGISTPEKKFHVQGDSYLNGTTHIVGSVGIGSAPSSTYKLGVNGTIGCKEVVVTTEGWSDYVFEPDYELLPLSELESFIQDNKHLPEIPSAAHVTENGVELSAMNVLLLKKVEELTLYILQQNQDIQSLKEEVRSLKEGR